MTKPRIYTMNGPGFWQRLNRKPKSMWIHTAKGPLKMFNPRFDLATLSVVCDVQVASRYTVRISN